ncbi:hypothetical protein RJ53_09850 [Methanocalculus chunghsingensis]|uniref:Uncharacterized protein n=1 Tax=Methanocalculus chunghsingensis TaxID=156457 RepID=A0A8J8B661_9EURY|nr:hypothetical protein [Methanocalculus chunghsingensis]MBR1369759.1 hypothetical protein [Methanocalculus chunghsingensis]
MKAGIILAVLFLFSFCCLPVAASAESRYSYITFHSVDISLEESRAVVTVDYSVDSGVQILVLFLGNQDLKSKVDRVMNFDNAHVRTADLNRAVLVVDSASFDYGDGSYWFPQHEFLVTIPDITLRTPQMTRKYSMEAVIEEGIGYFARPDQQRR